MLNDIINKITDFQSSAILLQQTDPILFYSFAFVIFIVFVTILIVAFAVFRDLKPIDLHNVNASSRQIQKHFQTCAFEITREQFELTDRDIYKKDGDYRTSFLNETDKTTRRLNEMCCLGNRFSFDFCDYVYDNHALVRKKNIAKAIYEYYEHKTQCAKKNLYRFQHGEKEITPLEFFELKSEKQGDMVGVYILSNKTQGRNYVGQATRLFFRVNQHFTGCGNSDVYDDYLSGDEFTIKMISLSQSGYDDLDQLEKDMIAEYHGVDVGYNKTVGNG